jgi:adenylate cyclase
MVDYLGDGLFAMWNAPVEQPDHAGLACRAALAIIDDLPEINRQFEETIGDPLLLGIGINSGMAMVGNNGSRSRFHYGPMGHTVNLASRVEGATKQLGVRILITGSTRAELGDGFETRRICRAKMAGMDEPVDLYELQSDSVAGEWKTHRDAYEWALELYETRKWGEACAALVELLADDKSKVDGPTVALVSRNAECLKSQPSQFEPVWTIAGK